MLRSLIAVSLIALVAGCNRSATDPGVGQPVVIGGEQSNPVAFNLEGLPTVSFDVPDMHCEIMCVPKVRDTLAAQPGVEEVQVDLDKKVAVVAIHAEEFDTDKAVAALMAAEFPESAVRVESSEQAAGDTKG